MSHPQIPDSTNHVLCFWFKDPATKDRYTITRDTAVILPENSLIFSSLEENIKALIARGKRGQAFWLYKKGGVELNGGPHDCLFLGWGGKSFKICSCLMKLTMHKNVLTFFLDKNILCFGLPCCMDQWLLTCVLAPPLLGWRFA